MYYFELQKIGIDAPMRTIGNVKVVCPKCRERKPPGYRDKDLSVNVATGQYNCHSGNCDFKGTVARKTEYSRPEWKNRTELPSYVVRWFEGRGISQKTLKAAKVTTDEKGNIEFNYFRSGELVNIKTRYQKHDGSKTFSQHKDAEKILYNLDSIAGAESVVFVEGEMDVLSWVESGLPLEFGVVSVDQGAPAPGQKLETKLDCLKNCAEALDLVKSFYICTDKDAPGQYLQEELIRRFGPHRCYIVDLPKGAKDANEVLDTKNGFLDPEARKETLRLCLKNARPVPLPGIQSLDDDMEAKMLEIYEKGRQRGKTTHYPHLDDHFTFLAGDMTLLTGMPNDGKGQFLRQLMVLKAKHDDWKWACYVPEDMTADFFFEDLCHIYLGKTTDVSFPNRAPIEDFRAAMRFVKKHFFIVDPVPDKETGELELPTNDWINKRINFLKLKYGVNAYVKDPWNKIAHNIKGKREDLYLMGELSREKFFARGFDAAMYVAHPTKMYKRENGSYPCPTAYDISGGAMFNNMCDNILSIYRPNRHADPMDKEVEVHSLKIKKQKLVGRIGISRFMFDISSGRYKQLVNGFDPLEGGNYTKVVSSNGPTQFPNIEVATIPNGYGREKKNDDDDIPF